MSSRRWRFFIEDMLSAIESVQSYVAEKSFDQFSRDDLVMAAVERKFITIGEAVKHIPHDVRESYSSIPWRQMADMRNLVTHFYWGVDPLTLWNTIQLDLPALVPMLERVLEETSD